MATHKCSGMGKGMKGSGKKSSDSKTPMKGGMKKIDAMERMTKKGTKKK